MWRKSLIVRNSCFRFVHVHVSTSIACFLPKTDWQGSTCFLRRGLTFETLGKLHSPHLHIFCRTHLLSHYYQPLNDNTTNNREYLLNVTVHHKQKMQPLWSTSTLNKFSKTYEETVGALNKLQSNAVTIVRSQKDPTLPTQNMILMQEFLKILEITQEDLKSLNVIHVAGTKGKGSTCAFTESILRSSGYKTGFFSSPHLVAVRERIRINGKSLPASQFVHYFWQVYNKIHFKMKNEDTVMPTYFMFLTLMAFHVFLHEKVDAAIFEVGIGGEYDCTNVICYPQIVGITSIGLDHVSLLGDTLEKIAWQKAGIMKEGVPAFTVQQSPEVLSVFLERANEKKCKMHLVPSLSKYNQNSAKPVLNISADIQEVNISLAFQLSHAWIERHDSGIKETNGVVESTLQYAKPFDISSGFENGLQSCVWLGRFQKISKDKIKYFLDGAHTLESIEYCADWFRRSSDMEMLKQGTRKNILKVLLFNCTRDRKPEILLFPLSQIDFDLAIFCTNNIKVDLVSSSDLTNYNADREKEVQQCQNNINVWRHFMDCGEEEQFGSQVATSTVSSFHSHSLIKYLVSDALRCIETPQYTQLSMTLQEEITKAEEIHVLVTGSLHLVGSVLSIIDPEMQCS